MKNLILKDGTTYQVEDNSNVGAFRFPVANYAEIDEIKTKMTRENLETVTVGVIEYHDVVNESVTTATDDNGQIVAIFLNRMGTQDIVQDAIDSYTFELMEGGLI